MALFIKLYQYILVPILSDWISAFDLCCVDTALCNRELRTKFLGIIAQCYVVNTEAKEDELVGCLDWVQLRGIRLLYYHLIESPVTSRLYSSMVTIKRLSTIVVDGNQTFAEFVCHSNIICNSLIFLSIKEDCVFGSILQSVKGVITLDLSKCSNYISLKASSLIADHCPNLRHLIVPFRVNCSAILQKCDLDSIQGCDAADVFDLPETKRYHFTCYLIRVSDSTRRTITIKDKHYLLKSLDIRRQLHNCDLIHLNACVESIAELSMVNDRSNAYRQSHVMALVSMKCISLIGFTAVGIVIETEEWEAVLAKNANLRSIDINDCVVSIDKCIDTISRYCSLLERLKLTTEDRKCSINCDGIVVELLAQCPQLMFLQLDLNVMSDCVLYSAVKNVDWVVPFSGQSGICFIIDIVRGLKRAQLASKRLPETEHLLSICSNNPGLKKLSVTLNSEWTAETTLAVVKLCPLLTHIGLCSLSTTLDEHWLPVADLNYLVSLQLHGASNITVSAIKAVLVNRPNFQSIDFTFCTGFSEGLLTVIATLCPSIRHLNVHYCRTITTADVIVLLNTCKKLRYLDLSGCKEVTAAILPYLELQCLRKCLLRQTGIDRQYLVDFVASAGLSSSVAFEY